MSDPPEGQPDAYEFDVAVSFAGQDREYVEGVVAQLKAKDVRVYLDSEHESDWWGEDLVEHFTDVYGRKARYAVIFVSEHYNKSVWTRLERRSALARALGEEDAYILPVRLDDAEVPGLLSTVGYLDAREVGTAGVVRTMVTKLSGQPSTGNKPIDRVPRTEVERQQLLIERPPGWEFLYLAAVLLHELNSTDDRYHDHVMSFAPPHGEPVPADGAAAFIQRSLDDALLLMENMQRVMDPAVQERAVGAPGEPGDASRIAHLAQRWNSIYIDLMDWAASVRGARLPSEYSRVLDLLAHFLDSSVETYRSLVFDLVEQVDKLPSQLEADEVEPVVMDVKFVIPPEVTDAFGAEMQRLAQD